MRFKSKSATCTVGNAAPWSPVELRSTQVPSYSCTSILTKTAFVVSGMSRHQRLWGPQWGSVAAVRKEEPPTLELSREALNPTEFSGTAHLRIQDRGRESPLA